jgi:hypothetical protein
MAVSAITIWLPMAAKRGRPFDSSPFMVLGTLSA